MHWLTNVESYLVAGMFSLLLFVCRVVIAALKNTTFKIDVTSDDAYPTENVPVLCVFLIINTIIMFRKQVF